MVRGSGRACGLGCDGGNGLDNRVKAFRVWAFVICPWVERLRLQDLPRIAQGPIKRALCLELVSVPFFMRGWGRI